jgi:hypothetical protein
MGKDAAAIRGDLKPPLSQMARQLAGEVFPGGMPWGTKFSELEQFAAVLGDEIARASIESSVQDQANTTAQDSDVHECPVCGRSTHAAPDEPRTMTTTQGKVDWVERVRNCPHCRRAFFPQTQALGLDRTGLSPLVQQKVV